MAAELQPDRNAWLADMACDSLLRHYPPGHAERFATYALKGSGRYACLGTNLEAEVFGEAFGDSQETLEREYGPYDAHSLFLTVVDTLEAKPAGVLRVIPYDWETGHKTINDLWAHLRIEPLHILQAHGINNVWPSVWDVGTLAVRKAYRGTDVSGMLFALLHTQAVAAGIEHIVTVLDARVLALLQGLGVPFEPICGSSPFAYMGSAKSVASILRVADAGPGVLQRLGGDDRLARMLAHGEGLPPLQRL